MTRFIEWFVGGWAVLSILSIGFVLLLAWRGRQRAAIMPSVAAQPAAPMPSLGDLHPVTFEARELDIGDEVAEALAQFRDVAQRHHVELQITAQAQLAVSANPGALRQMLARMLEQAMERG